jgi:hypothetical protein
MVDCAAWRGSPLSHGQYQKYNGTLLTNTFWRFVEINPEGWEDAKIWHRTSGLRNTRTLAILALIALLTMGCSSISLEAARRLSVTGRNAAVQAQQNTLVSDQEYLRARDSEALLHGFSGTTASDQYKAILKLYNDIHQELAQRAVVFEKLADLYDAFGELAGLDTGEQTEAALGNLSGAIEEYAKQLNQPSPLSSAPTAAIAKIGGLVAAEVQKAKIKEASTQIQSRVNTFLQILESALVREQMIGFQSLLLSDVKAALSILWDAGVYDPKPLLDGVGTAAGLTAQKDAAQLVKSNTELRKALGEVLDKRLASQMDLIAQGYDSSLAALRQLIAQHKKLEAGEPLDLIRLRAIVAQLRGIAVLLARAKTGDSTGQ